MNEIPAGLGQSLKLFVEPVAKASQLMSSQMEKWATLSVDSLKAYVDLGIAQGKVALKVRDVHSLSEFADSQFAVLSFMGHRMLDDGRALSEWGIDCCNQTNRLMRSGLLGMLFK
ncbi:MAG: phasin family protein [Gammaproteobacteria bacterium]|nr:phasin family protein [Gammaproteobacteria bacterium]MCP5196448.1 phasin family protein [Gammaproteobacteria bacterium]